MPYNVMQGNIMPISWCPALGFQVSK